MLIQRAELEPVSVPSITTLYYACIQPIRVYTKVRILYINVLKLPQERQKSGGGAELPPPHFFSKSGGGGHEQNFSVQKSGGGAPPTPGICAPAYLPQRLIFNHKRLIDPSLITGEIP